MTRTAKRRVTRIVVYVFLLASAGAAFLLGDWLWATVRPGDAPSWAPVVAPSIFTLFVMVYAVDRALLVRRRTSSLGRAFIQVGFAITFASLLWLWSHQGIQNREAKAADQVPDYRVSLLEDRRETVRAAGCELLGLRGDDRAVERINELSMDDESMRVRLACAEALQRLRAARTEPTAAPSPETKTPEAPEPGSENADPAPVPGP